LSCLTQVLAIDEAQFFDDLLEFVEEAADRDGKHIIVAGLSGDYRRRPFGQIVQLVPMATRVTMLAARCFSCKRWVVTEGCVMGKGYQQWVIASRNTFVWLLWHGMLI
jgi:thymidine kinase